MEQRATCGGSGLQLAFIRNAKSIREPLLAAVPLTHKDEVRNSHYFRIRNAKCTREASLVAATPLFASGMRILAPEMPKLTESKSSSLLHPK